MRLRFARLTSGLIVSGLSLIVSCSGGLETDKCTKTRLVVSPVDATDPAQLRISARLETEDGQPVANRPVIFSPTDGPKGPTVEAFGAETDANGTATVDMLPTAVKFRVTAESIRRATALRLVYNNPDGLNDAIQPNYCSTETAVPFRYTGGFPKKPS